MEREIPFQFLKSLRYHGARVASCIGDNLPGNCECVYRHRDTGNAVLSPSLFSGSFYDAVRSYTST